MRKSKPMHLQNSSDFRRNYAEGKRFDGKLMTAFVYQNDSLNHRLGITASRKMSGRAVDRNRAKRLLREAFRLSQTELDGLDVSYDWVINARRSLLRVKMVAALEDFQSIIERAAFLEREAGLSER